MESPKEKMDSYLKSIDGLIYGWNLKAGPIVNSNFFGCDEGWYPLIQELISDLIELGWNKEINQVKEKFGGLRFYINDGSSEIHEKIIEAERKSYTICEVCAESGKLRKDLGWLLTLCDSHYLEKKNKSLK
jgi:hypothetical protein